MGQKTQRECRGGDRHVYRLTMAAGQYLRVVVEQRGIDLAVTLFGPDGRQLAERDSPTGDRGPEVVLAVAEAAGEHRLEVRALDEKAVAGLYEVQVEELREATEADRRRVTDEGAIMKALGEAYRLRAGGTREGLIKAAEKLEEALRLLRAVGDSRGEAGALYDAGALYAKLGENQKAVEYHQQALRLRREMGDRAGEATSLYTLGVAYWQTGESTRALEYYNQALPLLRGQGDARGEATTLSAIGVALERLGRLQEALDSQRRSLALIRTAGKPREVANTLSNLGVLYCRLGEYQQCSEHYGEALSLVRAAGFKQGEATVLNNMGGLHWQLGDSRRALDYYNQALPLRLSTGDRNGEISTLFNIAAAQNSLGESLKALDSYGRVLTLVRAAGDRWVEAATLHNIGAVYTSLGDAPRALDHYNQALSLRRAVGDRLGEAFSLSQLGTTRSSMGEPGEALKYHEQALALFRAVGDWNGESVALKNIARAERDLGRLDEARTRIEEALRMVESTRSGFASQRLRASFSASRQEHYEVYIDLLMRMHRRQPAAGHDAAALGVSERARARSLVELLAEARADIRQGGEPALLERERSLQQRLNAAAERAARPVGGQAESAALQGEVEALFREYEEVQAQIRVRSPHYAALTQPRSLSLAEIQRELDGDTLLLEYALGEERSFLWAVTPTSMKSFELPGRAMIEDAARQVYQHLVAKSDALHPEALSRLSRTLLGPVADQLGRKRLLFVADGALHYVPFGALPAPAPGRQPPPAGKNEGARKVRPLLAEHEVVSLPSASVIALLRQGRPARQTAPRKLMVIADPVFDRHDRRVKAQPDGGEAGARAEGRRGPGPALSDIKRSADDVGLAGFVRLPLSRREAELIAGMLPKRLSHKAVDFAASRATATSPDLAEYQIVHFATHSLLNTRHPELSGIVLSLVDERGSPQDGFLRLHEIYNMKLRADLVVLSGCQTALGKEIKGEGLIGLTRGFMYAGSPRVVASLWEVSDSATAELMRLFYQNMVERGLAPAAALRAAQVSLSERKQWAAPFYWAGFVLQGEWR